jgi:hypothetical protein
MIKIVLFSFDSSANARSYSKFYKQETIQVQWKQDQSKTLKFTYDSIDSIQQEKFVLTILVFYFLVSLYFRQQLTLQSDQTLDDITAEIESVKEHDNHLDSSIAKVKKIR